MTSPTIRKPSRKTPEIRGRIVGLRFEGYTTYAIADKVGLSVSTVIYHLEQMEAVTPEAALGTYDGSPRRNRKALEESRKSPFAVSGQGTYERKVKAVEPPKVDDENEAFERSELQRRWAAYLGTRVGRASVAARSELLRFLGRETNVNGC